MSESDRHVLFRVDASRAIGGGHLVRCAALAQAFECAGWTPHFACQRGSLEVLPGLLSAKSLTLELDDANEIAQITQRWPDPFQLVIVDHYGLDASFELSLSRIADRVLAIEDTPNRHHTCDALLDQTYGRERSEYADLVPSECRILVGSRFAVLRREFSSKRATALKRRNRTATIERILVALGASDATLPTVAALEAISASEVPSNVCVDIVLGLAATQLSLVRAAAERLPGPYNLHVGTREIADLMVHADIAVGAAGSSAWERCCLGLPTVLVVMAENQEAIAANLDRAGAAVWAGSTGSDDRRGVVDAINSLANDPQNRHEMSTAAARICDGEGGSRVVEALFG